MADRIQFTAKLGLVGINRCVSVPANVVKTFNPEGKTPVVIQIAENSWRTTLLPAGEGRFRIFIPQRLLKPVNADVGETVSIGIWQDPEGWEMPLPDDLVQALNQIPDGVQRFENLSPALRREFIRWLDNARTAETREKRLISGLDQLLQR